MSSPEPLNYPQPVPMTPEDQRLWSTLVHIGGIFVGFWAALVGYLVLKDRGGFVRQHTVAALNFQLTMLIGVVVSCVLMLVLIGFLLYAAIWIMLIIFSIMAAMAANNGQPYTYPLSIQFVR